MLPWQPGNPKSTPEPSLSLSLHPHYIEAVFMNSGQQQAGESGDATVTRKKSPKK
jgi:hypothetical protein